MATTTLDAGFPQAHSPWIDKEGRPTRDFLYLIQALYARTGGSGTPPDITGLQEQLDAQNVALNTAVPAPQRPAHFLDSFVAIPPPAGAVNYLPMSNIFRSVQSKLRDYVSLKDFGAKIDGVTDDTAAVNAALASGQLDLYFPPGTCLISGTLTVSLNDQRLIGAGRNVSTFLVSTASLPAVSVGASLTGVILRDFGINRTPAATSGGDGIHWLTTNSQAQINNVLVQNCWNGFSLGPTDYSKLTQCIAQLNYNHGIYVTNGSGGGPCQWSILDCLSQNNNGSGLYIDGTSNAGGGISLGDICNFSTFANTGFGLIAAGSTGNPINGLRILGGFIGGDGNSEIYLDTYGGQHKIIGVESELTGTSATGRTNSTAASHIGSGVAITANNQRVQLSDPNINGTSGAGIAMSGTELSISNPHITNCGIAAISGSQNGVTASSGRTMVVGGYIADTGQGSQLFGVSIGSGASVNLTGVDLTGNVTAPYTGAGVALANIVNCLPNIAITTYTPTLTASSGTFTTASATGAYYVVGKMVYFEISATITSVGTGSGTALVTLPLATNSSGGVTVFNGVERALTGKTLQGFVSANSTSMAIRNYDASTVIAAGTVLVMSGCYLSH